MYNKFGNKHHTKPSRRLDWGNFNRKINSPNKLSPCIPCVSNLYTKLEKAKACALLVSSGVVKSVPFNLPNNEPRSATHAHTYASLKRSYICSKVLEVGSQGEIKCGLWFSSLQTSVPRNPENERHSAGSIMSEARYAFSECTNMHVCADKERNCYTVHMCSVQYACRFVVVVLRASELGVWFCCCKV